MELISLTVYTLQETEGMGMCMTNHGKLNLFNARYELDDSPIEEGCGCPACRSYSRAYIRHLLKAKEMLGMRLCVLHNLYFYNTMMEEIRDAIDAGEYQEYKKRKLSAMGRPHGIELTVFSKKILEQWTDIVYSILIVSRILDSSGKKIAEHN